MPFPKKLNVAVFNNTSVIGHFGCYAVMTVLHDELAKIRMTPSIYWPVARKVDDFFVKYDSIPIDILIVNGEGSIHDTKTSQYAKSLCSLAKKIKTKYSAKCFLLNSTIYNLDKESLDYLSHYDLIQCRDSASSIYLEKHNIASIVVPDFSFFYLTKKLATVNPNLKNSANQIVVFDSVSPHTSSLLRQISNKFNLKYFSMEPLSYFVNNIIVGHPRIDKIICLFRLKLTLFLLKLRPINVWSNGLSQKQMDKFVLMLLKCKLIISGRYHAVTLALSLKIPSIAIASNTPKLSYLFNDIWGNSDRITDINQLNKILRSNSSTQIIKFTTSELVDLDSFISDGEGKLNDLFLSIYKISHENQ